MTDDLTVFFMLLGSAPVKAECKTLVKSTHDREGERESVVTCYNDVICEWSIPKFSEADGKKYQIEQLEKGWKKTANSTNIAREL